MDNITFVVSLFQGFHELLALLHGILNELEGSGKEVVFLFDAIHRLAVPSHVVHKKWMLDNLPSNCKMVVSLCSEGEDNAELLKALQVAILLNHHFLISRFHKLCAHKK